jgi:hypothetical protein
LAIDHELLACPELKKWSEHLHDNVRYRAIKVIKNAAPEEEALEYLPKKGAAAGQLGPWRVNLTDVCNEALRASGWIIEPGTQCGPWNRREQVAEFGDRLREMRSRRAAAAAAPQGNDSAGGAVEAAGIYTYTYIYIYKGASEVSLPCTYSCRLN